MATGEAFFHGYTYSGTRWPARWRWPNLDIIEDEGLLAGSRRDRRVVPQAWRRPRNCRRVGDIRVAGATVGIELVTDQDTKAPLMAGGAAAQIRRVHGVIMRDYGPTLVLSPPLVLEKHQAERTATAIIEVLSRLDGDGRLAPR